MSNGKKKRNPPKCEKHSIDSLETIVVQRS